MNPVPVSWMLLGFIICAIGGAGVSGVMVYRWYRVSAIEAQNAALKADNKRFRVALGFSTEIDDENIKVELGNEEIVERIRNLTPAPVIITPHGQEPVAPVCVDAERMRLLRTLK